MNTDNKHILLICSVGGTPDPIVKSLLRWKPARLVFLPSEQTRSHVDVALRAYAEASGQVLSPGQYEVRPVADAEDLIGCVNAFRMLDGDVAEWVGRGRDDYSVAVDFTAGTKCITAALALVARRWPCEFSYVGGQRRTKEGVGVVETGTERVVHSANPWDALGYQAVEDAVAVFNHGGYAAAAHLLDGPVRSAEDLGVRRELSTLKAVIDAYAAWDRFDHKKAARHFYDALKNRNDLAAIFPREGNSLILRLERHFEQTKTLAKKEQPDTEWVKDLVHNARRRAGERRFDDAVARLYRACEALGQIRLRTAYGISDTANVPINQLPIELQEEWRSRARGDKLKLGLHDAFALLEKLGDDLGYCFKKLFRDSSQSAFRVRNQSILAHGFIPVSENGYKQLHNNICRLAKIDPRNHDDWSLPAAFRWQAV
ncbi:MAG: TIGR02710 family CRISPR-associated protein [Phycisphaerales bacterium]|nr:MAG: TIGR02710 family CRISPR-associated protein [Phycisphaerales bacterium]